MARKHTGEFFPKRTLILSADCTVHFRPALVAVRLVNGLHADRIGGYHLQMLADKTGMPVIVQPPSKHHSDKVYHPSNSQVSRRAAKASRS